MKKRILTILLVIVMVLTLTACVVDNTDAQTETTELALVDKYRIRRDKLSEMEAEEASDYLEELVHISETETLSLEDMFQLGVDFSEIWHYNELVYNMEEYKIQANEAYNNVHKKAIEQQIPLNKLYSWTWVPVADVWYKYFSSDNFSETKQICCNGFWELSEEEALLVAKAVFENPLFATNYWIAARDVIHSPYPEVQEMGWTHLVALSKSSDSKVTERTHLICYSLFSAPEMLREVDDGNQDKVLEIARNIMDNTYYDFVDKYTFFCGSYLDNTNIRNLAIENLLEMAKNPNQETVEKIKEVADGLVHGYHDTETANKLLKALEENS